MTIKFRRMILVLCWANQAAVGNDVVDVGGKRDEKRARTSLAGHLSPIKDREERGAPGLDVFGNWLRYDNYKLCTWLHGTIIINYTLLYALLRQVTVSLLFRNVMKIVNLPIVSDIKFLGVCRSRSGKQLSRGKEKKGMAIRLTRSSSATAVASDGLLI